jgi:hypothetical protein
MNELDLVAAVEPGDLLAHGLVGDHDTRTRR